MCFRWMFTSLVVHPGHKLYCMESSLRSDVWLSGCTTIALVDAECRIFVGETFPGVLGREKRGT